MAEAVEELSKVEADAPVEKPLTEACDDEEDEDSVSCTGTYMEAVMVVAVLDRNCSYKTSCGLL